uniref:Uncharacterized protein n=1 Tax=Bionectria ochroleuca TaxID=29856 RepID=A0A8H7N5U2_BIOOC
MFQRIRGAIDRTIAEEQARQRTLSEQGSNSRSASATRRNDAGRRQKGRTTSGDVGLDTAPTADPAVFEEAFVIDDSEEPSRAPSRVGTPKPTLPSAVSKDTDGKEPVEQNGTSAGQAESKKDESDGPQDDKEKRRTPECDERLCGFDYDNSRRLDP